jgi:elongation factor Ts
MTITATMVKDLREKTGAGMMDCKAALTETNGDVEAAIDWLRAKGLSKAAKKAGRVAAEGLVAVASSGNRAVIIEVNSETDFVARNPDFQALVSGIAQSALSTDGSVPAVLAAKMASGQTVEDAIKAAVATIGEHMALRRARILTVSKGAVASYIHGAVAPGLGKIGVIVGLESPGDREKLSQLGRQVAMHVAAASPLAVRASDIAADVVQREKAIFTEQAKESGKPAAVIEKMVEGRIRKFYEEVVLLSQAFVVDSENTVEKALKAAEGSVGGPISVTEFVCFRLGEGVEKVETDFSAEVAAASGVKS